MALVYDTGFEYESVIGDKTIKFKAWTAKNERDYLELLEKGQGENPEAIGDKQLFDILIKPCIEDPKLVLSAAEQKKLIIDIRKESISDVIIDTIKCDECGLKTDIEIKIDSIMKYVKSDFKEVEAKDLKFNFGPITDNSKKESLKLENGIVKYIFEDFMMHIISIEINGEVETEFSKKELEKFINSLPSKIFDKVFEAYQEQIDKLDLDYEFECSCGETKIVDYTYIPNFLWA